MLRSKFFHLLALLVLGAIVLTACGQTAVSSETASGDYVAPALATYDVGSTLGAGIGFGALALVLGLIAAGLVLFFLAEAKKSTRNSLAIGAFVIVAGLTFGIPAVKASYIVIEPGHVGVRIEQGTAFDEPMLEGQHWLVPFVQKARIFSTRPFTFSLVTDGEGETPDMKGSEQYRSYYQKFTTSDGVQGNMPYIIQAALNPQDAPQFYRDYGTLENGIVQLIKSPALPLVRDVLRGMTATEVVTTIDEQNAEVYDALSQIASEGGLTVIDFSFSQPKMGQWGVERDLTATTAQQALTEANKVEIAKATADANIETQKGINTVNLNAALTEAEIAKTRAQGEADAAKIAADAEAYTTLTTATAQAEANEKLALSLSEMLLKYQWILKWDGAQPLYVGGDGNGTLITLPVAQ